MMGPHPRMRTDAKKISAFAKVEGHKEIWKIKCDLLYPTPDFPVAILEWGTDMELQEARYVPVNPELLFATGESHIHFDYRNRALPIRIPKDLADEPVDLTEPGFRRGFTRLE
jgi:hypothetical protein